MLIFASSKTSIQFGTREKGYLYSLTMAHALRATYLTQIPSAFGFYRSFSGIWSGNLIESGLESQGKKSGNLKVEKSYTPCFNVTYHTPPGWKVCFGDRGSFSITGTVFCGGSYYFQKEID